MDEAKIPFSAIIIIINNNGGTKTCNYFGLLTGECRNRGKRGVAFLYRDSELLVPKK